MKKLLFLLVITVISIPSWANQRYQGTCQQSGITVLAGLNSTTTSPLTYPGATVTVNVVGGGLATIFSDNAGTPLANPFTASSSDATFSFYAANSSVNRYTVTCSGTGIPTISVNPDVLLFDPAVATFGTGAFSGNVTVGGTLGVTGPTTLSSTLGVTGASTLSSGVGSTINAASLNRVCVTDYQAGGDPGAKINACIAILVAQGGGEMWTTNGGTVTTQILFNNASHIHWKCLSTDGGGVSLVDGVVGNPSEPEVKITGTSSYDTIEGCSFPGNTLTGAGGNGHGIAIIGTGPTPATINLRDVDASGHAGTGKDGTGAGLAAAGVYVYKSIDVHIEGKCSFQANQYGFYADVASNDYYMDHTILNGNLTGSGKVISSVTAILTHLDVEANSGPISFDAVVNGVVRDSHFEGQTQDFLVAGAIGFSFNTQFAHNYMSHTSNTPGYVEFTTGSVSPSASDNTCAVATTGGSSVQCFLFDDGVLNPKAVRNHIMTATGITIGYGISFGNDGGGAGTTGGLADGNTCGRTSANVDGTITRCVAITGSSSNVVARDNQCVTNTGASITHCVLIESTTTNTYVENTTCTQTAGTISNCNNNQGGGATTIINSGGVLSMGANGVTMREGAAPSGSAGNDLIYPDSTAHRLKMNNNNGGATTVAGFADNLSVFASGGAISPASMSVTGQITSTLAIGTAPLVITSTTPVANLTVQNCGATCAITQPTISTGVSQGSGHKHQRFGTLCTTANVAGATCTTPVTWTAAFADANYTVSCTGITQTNVPTLSVESIAGAGFTIRISTVTANAATFATVDCIADHD